jgi:hypothetical protein
MELWLKMLMHAEILSLRMQGAGMCQLQPAPPGTRPRAYVLAILDAWFCIQKDESILLLLGNNNYPQLD